MSPCLHGSNTVPPAVEPIGYAGEDEYEVGYNDGWSEGYEYGRFAVTDEDSAWAYAHGRRIGLIYGLVLGAVFVAVAVVATGRAHGADPELDRARLQARLLVERFTSAPASREVKTWTDHAAVTAEAKRTGQPVVLWHGISPVAYPDFVNGLGDVLHYQAPYKKGLFEGVMVVNGTQEFFVRPENLDANRAGKVLKFWAEGPGLPSPSKARLRGEVSRAPSAVIIPPPRYYSPPPPVCLTG